MNKVLTVLSFAMLLTSCVNDKAKEEIPNPQVDCDTTFYKREIKAIIISNCATSGCHESGNSSIPSLTNYTEMFVNRTELQSRVNKDANDPAVMPPSGPLSAADVAKINQWINSGAAGCE